MKAIVCNKYGLPAKTLQMADMPKPIPKDNEILVEVYASSANAGDWHITKGDPYFMRLSMGLSKPKWRITGSDIAGRVEAVGGQVKQFKPGDEVFGDISYGGFGAHAEYATGEEKLFTKKPASVSFTDAAAVPVAGVTALQGLRDKAKVRAGQEVLVTGAGGGVGSYAVQLAKYYGAKVTAVCSTGKVEMVQSLGADQVIDYTRQPLHKMSKKYDLVFAAGGSRSMFAYKRLVKPGGLCVVAGGSVKQFMQVILLGSIFSGKNKKVTFYSVKQSQSDLAFLAELLGAGKIEPPIKRTCSLSETPEAIQSLFDRKVKGKWVISIKS